MATINLFIINNIILVVFLIFLNVNFAKNLDIIRIKRQDIESNSCSSVITYFSTKNITIFNPKGEKGPICGGKCCNKETESQLKYQIKRDFADLLSHNSRTLLGPLSRISTMLQNYIWELADVSENKSLSLFTQIYRNKAVNVQEPIQNLYHYIRDYIKLNNNNNNNNNNEEEEEETLLNKSPEDITRNVYKFFSNLFPVAYHKETGLTGEFTPKYLNCLQENMETIQPFNDFPKQVADSLSKSLAAVKLLLESFQVGIDVLNTTDQLIINEYNNSVNSECHSALLKMTYCSKCEGFKNSKPCSGYCLNVLRGCTSKFVAELDAPWSNYVEGVESLVNALKKNSNSNNNNNNNNNNNVNIDSVLRNLDAQITSSIMYFMGQIKEMAIKVKMTCKLPEFLPAPEALILNYADSNNNNNNNNNKTRGGGGVPTKSMSQFPHFPEMQINSFISTLEKTKGFYSKLADNLCGDESFADQRDKKCWNGERIGEYSKTVIGVAVDMQKYNPELKAANNLQNVEPKIATLVDKLRHVHHTAFNSLGTNYSENDMQRDGGIDGSGSGNGPDIDGEDDEDPRGSGSGNGPIDENEEHHPSVTIIDETPRIYSVSGSSPILLLSSTNNKNTNKLIIFIVPFLNYFLRARY